MQVSDVPNVDPSGSQDRYLALRLVLVYTDLASRSYHAVIRLSDPENGMRRHGGPVSVGLIQDGSEIGEGEEPLPQWRVTFFGNTTREQDARLRGERSN